MIRHMLDFTLGHVGLHIPGRDEAEKVTDELCRLMAQDKIIGTDNFLLDPLQKFAITKCLEVMDISVLIPEI